MAMGDDSKTLGAYGTQEGQVIHVVDSNMAVGSNMFDDVTKVEKYVMKNEDYIKREDTFQKFKQQNQANKRNEARDAESKIGLIRTVEERCF